MVSEVFMAALNREDNEGMPSEFQREMMARMLVCLHAGD